MILSACSNAENTETSICPACQLKCLRIACSFASKLPPNCGKDCVELAELRSFELSPNCFGLGSVELAARKL